MNVESGITDAAPVEVQRLPRSAFPRPFVWFLWAWHAVVAAVVALVMLVAENDTLDVLRRVPVAVMAVLLIRSAARAATRRRAVLFVASAGALGIAFDRIVHRTVLWWQLWPTRHDVFWLALPAEISAMIVLAAGEAAMGAIFALLVYRPAGGGAQKRIDWPAASGALWISVTAGVARMVLGSGSRTVDFQLCADAFVPLACALVIVVSGVWRPR